ncbi:MAG: PEP-CTERM sorting domain-containing protein [Methylophilaceae bacterium]|nr:PEP-CTERM sorting domain-containing protein [Methylophilaceae bacterium]
MKSLFSLTALALALSGTAQADNINIDYGVIAVPTTISQIISHNVGTFTDIGTFDIAPPGLYSGGSFSNLQITITGIGDLFNINGLSVQLFNSSNVLIDNLDDNTGSSSEIKVGSGNYAAGLDYYFKVTGNANGSLGGKYVFSVATLPVPEPETYAMLLAGLGLLGAVARRRK